MQAIDHAFAVIMAGGGGTRLWPLSRKETPKQLLDIFGGKTLFEIAIERLDGVFAPENIFIVTIAEQAEKLMHLAPQIPVENYLLEPMPRGTAAVVALGAATIAKKDSQGIMVVLTADHFIQNVAKFQLLLASACKCAEDGQLVTLGIAPTFPATGYGYIETGELVGSFLSKNAFKVARFVEKPDETKAHNFVESGRFFWNSGMFIWRASVILEEFRQYLPELYRTIEQLSSLIGSDHRSDEFRNAWANIHPETIDYGIMEKSRRVVVFPVAELGWNDVGSWDSLFDVMPADENGNVLLGDQILATETSGSLVYSGEEQKLIVPLGVQNMIIVNTPDALLICPRGESQQVKKLVEYLKTNHYTLFL
jgi:mannose-1-phosphate guanylyltransferase